MQTISSDGRKRALITQTQRPIIPSIQSNTNIPREYPVTSTLKKRKSRPATVVAATGATSPRLEARVERDRMQFPPAACYGGSLPRERDPVLRSEARDGRLFRGLNVHTPPLVGGVYRLRATPTVAHGTDTRYQRTLVAPAYRDSGVARVAPTGALCRDFSRADFSTPLFNHPLPTPGASVSFTLLAR